MLLVIMASEVAEEIEREIMVRLGSFEGMVKLLMEPKEEEEEQKDEKHQEESGSAMAAAEETMLLWGIQQPTLSKPNAFVSQSSLHLFVSSCGHSLSILQSPSSLVCFYVFSTLFV